MENASKAIVMAGAVLIAVALISLAIYAYTSFSDYARANEELLTISQIESFNRFYESYRNRSGQIRGVDVINIINKANDDEIENVPPIPAELRGVDQAYQYLDLYNYGLGYDVNGKVDTIIIN